MTLWRYKVQKVDELGQWGTGRAGGRGLLCGSSSSLQNEAALEPAGEVTRQDGQKGTGGRRVWRSQWWAAAATAPVAALKASARHAGRSEKHTRLILRGLLPHWRIGEWDSCFTGWPFPRLHPARWGPSKSGCVSNSLQFAAGILARTRDGTCTQAPGRPCLLYPRYRPGCGKRTSLDRPTLLGSLAAPPDVEVTAEDMGSQPGVRGLLQG